MADVGRHKSSFSVYLVNEKLGTLTCLSFSFVMLVKLVSKLHLLRLLRGL